jgi:predicted DNA-binding antitoxin AbrB/MazE fold protein
MKYAVEGIYRNGVVELLEDVPVHKPMKVFVLFREDFYESLENKDWLKLSETAFKFWDNEEDAYYDDL